MEQVFEGFKTLMIPWAMKKHGVDFSRGRREYHYSLSLPQNLKLSNMTFSIIYFGQANIAKTIYSPSEQRSKCRLAALGIC